MDNLKESIIITAARMFDQYGIRSTSVDNVCSELHISKKTFYTFFQQKEDLIEQVLEYNRTLNKETYNKLFRDKNAIDSLILIIREIRKKAEQQSSDRMCHDLEKYYPHISEKYNLLNRENIRIGFENNLRQGIEEGYFREDLDVELISYFHSIQIKNAFEMMQKESKKYSKKRLIEFFIDLMIHVIANEKGLKYMEEHVYRDHASTS